MASTPQFADLTTIPTQTQTLNNEVLPQLAAQPGGLSVTSWVLNGVYRSLAMAVAYCRTNARLMLAALTAAGFEDYVFGRAAAPGGLDVTGWAPLVAKQRYGIIQKPATYTQRTITLTNSSVATYSNIQPGAIIIIFPSGNRYVLNQVVTLPAAVGGVPSVTTATFRSEFLMALGLTYNSDPSSANISFVTSNFPGVTATNPASSYSPVAQSGGGVGLVTPGGSPTGNHQITVQITGTGSVSGNTVLWSTSIDGATFVQQSGSTATNIGGTGINVTLSDNGGSPAFVVGTFYYFSTPGTDITQVGAAIETPQSLGARCSGMWPLLSFTTDANGNFVPPASPTQSAYVTLALSQPNVVVAYAYVDSIINNLIHLYIAGQGGATLPPATLASTQTFFNTFQMLTDKVVCATPNARPVTLGMTGAIAVRSTQLASVQATMQARLSAYLGGTDANQPLGINGLIDYDYLISLIRTTPGVLHVPVGGLTITTTAGTVSTDVQLPITPGAVEVAQWTQQVATAFSFLPQ